MKAFITGVTGFVGSHLAEHLLANGDEVTGCSPDARWPDWAPHRLREQVRLYAWDLQDPPAASLREQLADFAPGCFYHLAALSIPDDCGSDDPTDLAWRVNVDGTTAVARLASQLPTVGRVLFTSSSHVYAPVSVAGQKVNESWPTEPTKAYGKTKLAAEGVLRQAVDRGFDAIIVRAFQHAGPRQSPRLMLSEWCRQFAAAEATPVRIYNQDSYLDMSDVRDVVRAYRLLVERGKAGETYNVGSGVCLRSGDVFHRLRELVADGRTWVEVRPGPRFHPIADISRLQAATGWQPEIPLDDTLRDAFEFWQRATPSADTDGIRDSANSSDGSR